MSGVSLGIVSFAIITVLSMGVLCFLLSLITRQFLRGPMLVGVTVLLALLITVLLAAAGMAKSDFSVSFILPYGFCGAVVALSWLLGMKGHKSNA